MDILKGVLNYLLAARYEYASDMHENTIINQDPK
jgi:hypothetical protein